MKLDSVVQNKMVPDDTSGHRDILDQYGETVFFNPEYLIDRKELYGTSREAQIWKLHSDTGIINLYFSAPRSCFRGSDFNLAVSDVKKTPRKPAQKVGNRLFPKSSGHSSK